MENGGWRPSGFGENPQGSVPFVRKEIIRRQDAVGDDPEPGATSVVAIAVGSCKVLGRHGKVFEVLEERASIEPFAARHGFLAIAAIVF